MTEVFLVFGFFFTAGDSYLVGLEFKKNGLVVVIMVKVRLMCVVL